MFRLRHPFSRAVYSAARPGEVQVTDRSGNTGRYDVNGRWLEGRRMTVDPELCRWIATSHLSTASRHRQAFAGHSPLEGIEQERDEMST